MAGLNGTSLDETALNATFGSLTPLLLGQADTGGEQPPPTDAEQELLSLEAELHATTARAAATRARVAARELEVRTALRAELDASRMVLDELERQHELTVATIEEGARVEVARILADARRVAAAQWSGPVDNDE